MSILHHDHRDAGFPDPQGDRSALMGEIGRLRRRLHEVEDQLVHVTKERDHWKQQATKRRWLR